MKKLDILILTICISLFNYSCDDSSNSPTTPPDHGMLKVLLTDAPAAFDSVNITFSEIKVNLNGEWISVSEDTQSINLLDLSNGKTTEIGSEIVPVGLYTQMRLKIIDANVVVNSEKHSMDVPSGAQSGLKLNANFEIVEGSTYETVLDFDANRSIVTTGPPNNPNGYKLKPTIRVISTAVTGSISGIIANSQNLPIAVTIVDTGTVTSSQIDTTTGSFRLAFLPEGYYQISIEDTLNQTFAADSIQVTIGADNDLGELLLQ